MPIHTYDVAKKPKNGLSILPLDWVWCWSNNANECAWLPEGAYNYPHSSALRIPENCCLNSRPYQWDWTSLRSRRKRSKLDFASLLDQKRIPIEPPDPMRSETTSLRPKHPFATLPSKLGIGCFRYPLRQVLGYGGFRRIHAHSCLSARYRLILLGLRFGKP